MLDSNQQGHQVTAIVAAFNRWRLEHALVAIRVRDALNNRAPESVLRPLVEEARGQLWALFAMKKVGHPESLHSILIVVQQLCLALLTSCALWLRRLEANYGHCLP